MASILQFLTSRQDELRLFPALGNAAHFAANAKEKIKHLPGLKLKCIEENEEEELVEGIVVVRPFRGKQLTFPAMRLNWVFIAPCKGIHNSLGFWILRCGFQIPDSNRL